jgi:hypothetical protein
LSPPSSPSSRSHTGVIVGSIIAGIILLAAALGLWYFLRARRRKALRDQPSKLSDKEVLDHTPLNSGPGPYEVDGNQRPWELRADSRQELSGLGVVEMEQPQRPVELYAVSMASPRGKAASGGFGR